jgi:hypothetical protein
MLDLTLAAMGPLIDAAQLRAPDEVIPEERLEDPYLRRWHIRRDESGNVYLHCFLRSDDDRALHDHPWDSVGIVLKGTYVEITPYGEFVRNAGDAVFRKATDRHRIVLTDGPVWTLFITGPKCREWGFWCDTGFVHWTDFGAAGCESPAEQLKEAA